jgi:hypothetical protein
MRCISCGLEMRLVQIDHDDSMMVPGYERHTLHCADCNELEHRLVFNPTASPPSTATASHPALPSAEQPSAEAAPIAPSPADSTLAPAMSMLSADEKELDEREELLRRAIAMVRGVTRGARSTPSDLANTLASKKRASRVVRIRHDPRHDARFAAADSISGVVVLRHQDQARLREMCDRLGWLVEDSPGG